MTYFTEVPEYSTVHQRIRRRRGKAFLLDCVDCGRPADEWSYSGDDPDELEQLVKGQRRRYSADPAFYDPRCRSCHRRFDA